MIVRRKKNLDLDLGATTENRNTTVDTDPVKHIIEKVAEAIIEAGKTKKTKKIKRERKTRKRKVESLLKEKMRGRNKKD